MAGKIDSMQEEIDLLKADKSGAGDAIASASAKIVMEAKIAAADTVSDALSETDPRLKRIESRIDALEAAPPTQPAAAAPPKPASGKARKGGAS